MIFLAGALAIARIDSAVSLWRRKQPVNYAINQGHVGINAAFDCGDAQGSVNPQKRQKTMWCSPILIGILVILELNCGGEATHQPP